MKVISLLTGLALSFPGCALAQVTVNPAALQQLAGIVPPPPVSVVAPVRKSTVRHIVTHHHVAAAAKPRVAAPVPVVARLAPPAPAAPKAVPITPLAPAALEFAPGSADLPAGAAEAIKPFCGRDGVIEIDSRAPADAADPSAAMRLSLARAFAVRNALTACGVAPHNILPRALGAVPGADENKTVLGSGTVK